MILANFVSAHNYQRVLSVHNAVLAATVARLSLALLLAVELHRSISIAIGLLIVVIAADILDGVMARRLGVDTNSRRIADTTVDMLSTHVVLLSFIAFHPNFSPLYLPLALRDLASAGVCSTSLLSGRALIVGGNLAQDR